MANAQYSKALAIAGINFSRQSNIVADGANAFQAVLTPAKALSSWVKTDADTAAGNLAGGHGLSTGTFDVYWTGGARYDVPVTISTNACTLDGGHGDDFPASATTTVVLAPQTELTGFTLDGDNAEIVAVAAVAIDPTLAPAVRLGLYDVDDDLIEEVAVTCNGDPNVNDIYAGEANRYTGDPITYGMASTAYTGTDEIKLNVGYLYNT
jgi:hypothetical protein